ncbi:MAG: thioesterase family protein [Bacillota bacterium]
MEDAQQYLRPNAAGSAEEIAGEGTLASRYGSGALDVYSTPAMVALMEGAAVDAVAKELPEGWTTVGISLDIRHLEPSPPGSHIVARARLREMKGLRLIFDVEAEDDVGNIGEGTHQRYCVEAEPFLAAAAARHKGEGESR